MATAKRILVVGAGSSGLTSIKACTEENLDVVCFEKSGCLGGLWRYHEDDMDGLSSVMKSTIANTSKEMSSFSDFPPPAEFPTYMHHSLVLKYLELYAEHFDLLSSISYYHEVTQVIPAEDYSASGRWLVTFRDLSADQIGEEVFDGVMICVGHHAFPIYPSYPGLDSYTGQVIHSHSYKTFNGMENKTILVVGFGNSGADIAVELSTIAEKVYLSTRRGTWVFPRTLEKGKPLDALMNRRSNSLLPSSFLQWKLENSLNAIMQHEKFGIKPCHRVGSQHPTANDDVRVRLLSGMITVKRNIKEFTEFGVIFEDEEEAIPVDVLVFATGYEIKFPFVNEDIIKITKNKALLYKNVFPPQCQHSSLAVIGLIQPWGPLFPVFEMQARWYARLATGRIHLPDTDTMLADVKADESVRARRYVQSPRHTLDVPWLEYMDDIADKIGAKPNLQTLFFRDQTLFWMCFKGPCLPYQYRLKGPHSWEGAREAILTHKSRLYGHMQGRKKGTQSTN